MEKILEWWNNPEEFSDCLKECHRESYQWDNLFMRMAKEIATMSKCASRQIGALIVKNNNVLSIGFNGSPSKSHLCQTGKVCPRRILNIPTGQHLDLCPAQHAERNTITLAAKHGVATDGATLYCFCGLPCQQCAGAIINSGIKRIVCLQDSDYDNMAGILLQQAGVIITRLKKEDI